MSLSKSVPHKERTGKVIGFQEGLFVQLTTSVLNTNWYCPSSPTLNNSKNGYALAIQEKNLKKW